MVVFLPGWARESLYRERPAEWSEVAGASGDTGWVGVENWKPSGRGGMDQAVGDHSRVLSDQFLRNPCPVLLAHNWSRQSVSKYFLSSRLSIRTGSTSENASTNQK